MNAGLSGPQRRALLAMAQRYEEQPDGEAQRPIELLVRALVRAETGHSGAAEDARLALRHTKVALPAIQVLFALGHFGEAVDALARLGGAAATFLRVRYCEQLGWTLDALEAIQEGLDQDIAPAAMHHAAARIYRSSACSEQAATHAASAFELTPGDADVRLMHARCLQESGAPDEADKILAQGPADDPRYRLEAGRLRRALRRYEKAQDDFTAAMVDYCSAAAERAFVRLQLGDENALHDAQAALRASREEPRAAVVLGLLALQVAKLDDAKEKFMLASKNDRDSALSLSWLAEVYRRRGQHDKALSVLQRARSENPALAFVLRLQRIELTLGLAPLSEPDLRALEVAHADVSGLEEPSADSLHATRLNATRLQVRAAIDRFGLDRESLPSGQPGYTPPPTLRQLRAVGERTPRADAPSLRRWFGDAGAAPSAALALDRGDPQGALELDPDGPCRGEALRRLGKAEEAQRWLLERAQLEPDNVAHVLNLAATADEVGDQRLKETMHARLSWMAAPLMSDAERYDDSGLAEASGSREESAYERALRMLGASRTLPCYRARTDRGVRIRFLPDSPRDPTKCRNELREVRRRLGIEATYEGPAVRAAAEPALDASQIEHFVEHGWVALRGGFDAELARLWVDRAAGRIRAMPDAFVKGFGPTTPPLWRFDARSASDCGWTRIELDGLHRASFEDAMPRVWSALDQLVGVDKVATKDLCDYFVLNVADPSSGEDKADVIGWHVDDPNASMSLANLRNGIVLLMLFSDCAPGEGGTLLLDGSAKAAARRLQTEPVDMVGRTMPRQIAAQGGDVVQAHGKAGDVYLCHSLLLHTSAPNPSGRVRWLANPMIYLKEPPRLDSSDPTPFERSLTLS